MDINPLSLAIWTVLSISSIGHFFLQWRLSQIISVADAETQRLAEKSGKFDDASKLKAIVSLRRLSGVMSLTIAAALSALLLLNDSPNQQYWLWFMPTMMAIIAIGEFVKAKRGKRLGTET